MKILNEKQENLLKSERQTLNNLRAALAQFGASTEDSKMLAESIVQLEELFLLVVVGEFNAGKSAFINALLGQRLLKEGVTPTTTQINLLQFGAEVSHQIVNEQQQILTLPVDWLAEINIVDTPGTNAIIRSHEVITSQFVPRSDLVLFITSADRPFTESERLFLEQIRNWGKKIVIIVNKIDILSDESEIKQIVDFLAESAQTLLHLKPEIFPVSARLALKAKQGEPELFAASKFEPLESYIRETLDEKSRIRLKFLNPVGVGLHLSERYLSIVSERLEILKEDTSMLADVELQLNQYEKDMLRDFNFRISDIDNTLFEMEKRGNDFFDDTFRLARVIDLVNKDRIRLEFEKKVIADVPNRIEKKVNEMIDWLVDADLQQWQAVNDHLAERRRAHQNRIIGQTGPGTFTYDRERIFNAVGREAQQVVNTFDKSEEAKAIADGAREAVAASAILEIGAIGLGALVTALATTVAADVTGILMATFLAALGLVIIPAKRRTAKTELKNKIAELRKQLTTSLSHHFEAEIHRSLKDIQDAISPYTRFVRSEQGKLLESQELLERIRIDLNKTKLAIEEWS